MNYNKQTEETTIHFSRRKLKKFHQVFGNKRGIFISSCSVAASRTDGCKNPRITTKKNKNRNTHNRSIICPEKEKTNKTKQRGKFIQQC